MVIATALLDRAPAAADDRMLSVTTLPRTRPGRVVIEVVGDVDAFTAPLLVACLRSQARRPEVSDLVVDLRQVSFLGGAGIRAVTRAARLCRRRGAGLSVRCEPGIVHQAFQLTGFGHLVSVDPPATHRAPGHRSRRRPRVHGGAAVPENSAS